MKVANWKQRLIVFLIDYGIVFGLFFLVGQLFRDEHFQVTFLTAWNQIKEFKFGGAELIEFATNLSTLTALYYTLTISAIYILYFCIIPLFWSKQTIGRLVAKVRIVKLNGTKMTFGTLLFRDYVGKFFLGIMTLGVIWIISVLMMSFARVHRTIHDRMANTLMVPTSAVVDNHLVIEENMIENGAA